MAHTNNSPIKPAVQRRFEAALGICGQAPLAHDVSFVAAQKAARKWADEALDLGQAGDTERARYARFHAEAWLVKMLALEAQEGILENDKLPIARPRAQRRSPSKERPDAKFDNATLSNWPRHAFSSKGK